MTASQRSTSPAVRAQSPGRGRANRFLLPLLVGCALNPLNSTIISISLVLIADDFDVPLEQTFSLIAVFYVVSAVGQPIFGNLADRLSAYPLFAGGMLIAAGAGLLGALAPNLSVLILARFLLATGTAASYPAAIVMVRRRFEADGESALRPIGWIAVSQQVAASLGPPVGGVLLGHFGWQAAFLLNLPVALGALALAESARRRGLVISRSEASRGPKRSLDLGGSTLFALTLGALFLATSHEAVPAWAGATLVAVTLTAFVVVELRTDAPLLDVRLMATSPPLSWIYVRFFLAGLISYSVIILWPQWLQQGRGLSVTATGLALIPMAVLAPIAAAIAGKWLHYRAGLVIAHLAMAAGCGMLLVLNDDSPHLVLAVTAVCFAIPTGLLHLANQSAVVETAPPDRTGLSVGLLRSVWYVGAIITSSVGTILFSDKATTSALHELARVLCASSLFILVVDGAVGVRRRRQAGRTPVPT